MRAKHVHDIAFDQAADVALIRYRIAPIDVGFDLRTQGIPVEIDADDDPIRISYGSLNGHHRVMSGPQSQVLRRLRSYGYSFRVKRGPAKPKPWEYQERTVCIDDPEGGWDKFLIPPTRAYVVANDRWNGFKIPFFTKSAANQVMKAWNRNCHPGEEGKMAYNQQQDAYIVACEGSEDTETYEGHNIEIDGRTIHVYGVGAMAWVWDYNPNPRVVRDPNGAIYTWSGRRRRYQRSANDDTPIARETVAMMIDHGTMAEVL